MCPQKGSCLHEWVQETNQEEASRWYANLFAAELDYLVHIVGFCQFNSKNHLGFQLSLMFRSKSVFYQRHIRHLRKLNECIRKKWWERKATNISHWYVEEKMKIPWFSVCCEAHFCANLCLLAELQIRESVLNSGWK